MPFDAGAGAVEIAVLDDIAVGGVRDLLHALAQLALLPKNEICRSKIGGMFDCCFQQFGICDSPVRFWSRLLDRWST